ncbi:hypothetical protein pb186bvf_020025 [Paramecium bursaria]
MIIVVRHGERADQSQDSDEYSNIELQFDPHLTKVGNQQAIQTGKYIQDLLKNFKDIEVVCMSSPYLRCITTAKRILEQLNCQQKIYIQHEISEFQMTYDFDKDHQSELHLQRKNVEKYIGKQDIINQKYFVDPKMIEAKFPETMNKAQERTHLFLQALETKYKQENKIYICVTHQGVIEAASQYFGKNPPFVDYCGMVIVDMTSRKLLLNGQKVWKQ